MNLRMSLVALGVLLSLASRPAGAQLKTVLFDAKHAQTVGNADWTLDEDSCGTAQRFPTPAQSGITSSTAETYWNGGFSAMGVDLVKKGFAVESLPPSGQLTYGNGTNAQDLANYNVLVLPEPNVRYTAAEITAVRSFVQNGGGLFLISDHAGADRNSDGWDAAEIFNELVGSPSVFGITFNANSADTVLGWFDDHPNGNFTIDTTSPIIFTGAFGNPSSTRGLGLFGSTTMTLSGSAKGHIWRTTSTHDTSTGVTFATSTYGTGRVAAVGDSSTAEDATNGCGHTTYLGYNDPAYDNGKILANAVYWLANGTGGGGGGGTSTDISGWTITQANASVVYTIPAGTVIPANGYLVVGRDATKTAFQTFWGVTLGSNVVYLTTAGAFPQINGSENYTLKNASGTIIDGPTISTSSSANQSLRRNDPCLAAGTTSSWTIGLTTTGNPGSGAGTGCAKGMVINEFSDAAGTNNFVYEFIELHNDK
ncbi:MAG: hypothetical protein QOH21_417 [Acidobacteriota bacterium]|nr:hypothetical protein [Acidobacteriota bacterium]